MPFNTSELLPLELCHALDLALKLTVAQSLQLLTLDD
jgi:hypothetical protein